jgi:type VI secretion system protein ImpA
MPDALVNGSDVPSPVDHWLLPLEGTEPCGPDLEYDPQSLELTEATGKPESQFGPGEPPAWARVRELAESLLERTRDLRVAVWWGRASLNLDGIEALPPTLALLHGLLDRFWDQLHPVPDPDDPDMLARLSAIGGLDKLGSLLGDVRNARLSNDRRLNGLRVRDVEVALGKLTARPDEAANTPGQIQGQLAEAGDLVGGLARQVDAALASIDQLRALMNERFRADLVVDLKSLEAMLTGVRGVLPADAGVASEAEPASDPGAETVVDAQAPPLSVGTPARRAAAGVHSVESRQDAMRAIDLVCAYLERTEPTNPAQLFLRRAGRVIDMNFLQLMDELAPDSLKDVARIMGVDPGSVSREH